MILHTLKLKDVRAHASTELTLGPSINFIDGPNGAGKTNILEAVFYLCLSKSFLGSKDRDVLRQGADFFEVEGRFESGLGRRQTVRVAYMPSGGKRMFVNGAALERLVDIVGRFPVVIMEPGVGELTMGAPANRRQFLNNNISQARPSYMENLIRYRRVLRQRNELLYGLRGGPVPSSTLEPWTALLIESGAQVIAGRLRFLREMQPFLQQAWEFLELDQQNPSIRYRGLVQGDNQGPTLEAIEEAFRRALDRNADQERSRGRTCTGPHLDDLPLYLNGRSMRHFASTGQHRAVGIALKLAQYLYLQHQMDETPILLLDDIFDSLDSRRTGAILEWLQAAETGQSMVTTTDARRYAGQIPRESLTHVSVANGRVKVLHPGP